MAASSTRTDPRAHRRGLTLVELVISFALAAILLTGMTSAVVLASRALPENTGAADAAVNSSDVMQCISNELRNAVCITENTATAVTFTVADRDGNGSPERIRYAWSGTAGQPLTRQYNSGTAVTVLDDVQQFALTYDVKSVTEQYPGPPVEGWEEELNYFDQTYNWQEHVVTQNAWVGQYFRPSTGLLPSNAVSWRVSRVYFQARRCDSLFQDTRVQIRSANADHTPTTTVLGEQTMSEWWLSYNPEWYEFAFDNVAGLSPLAGVCLVLERDGSGSSARVRYDGSLGSDRVTSNNLGATWTVDTTKEMLYYAYGTVSVEGPTQTVTRQYVTGVRVTLRTGADTDARLDTTIHLLNAPELLAAIWQLDFNSNPTTVDLTSDSVADWVRRDGQAFNTATLVGGVWQADATLDTRPVNNFTQITTTNVRFRNTTVGGNGAVFWINADWSDGMFIPLYAYLQLQADGTQTLTVYGKQDSSTAVALVTLAGLSSGFVNLRLVIDPGYDTVNIKVNDANAGTFSYTPFTQSNTDQFASILASGSSAEFDSVSVRVGGTH